MAVDPNQPRALKLFGLSLQLKKYNEEAEQAFLLATRLRPTDPDAWFFLGRIHYIRNYFNKALSALDTALQYRRTNPAALEYRGLALEATGQIQLALLAYEEAVKELDVSRQPFASPCISYGMLLYKTNRFGESEVQFKRAKQVEPANWRPSYELGKLYFRQERLAEAKEQLQSALSSGTANPEEIKRIEYLLARTYQAMGRSEEGDQIFAAMESSRP